MTTTPIAHWTMDNVSGSTLIDEAGTYGGTIANMSQTDSGQFDKYLAGGSVASVARSISFSPFVPFKSLSIWFRASSLSGDLRVLYPSYSSNNVIYFYDAVLQVYASGNQTCSLSLPDTGWHHLAIIEGSNNNYHWIYLDGVKDTAERRTNAVGEFQLFGSGGTNSISLVPDFDNIQVYDYKLTDPEIAYLASATSQTQTLPIPVGGTALAAILVQSYILEGSPRALLDQDWALLLSLRNVVNQDWSLRMLQILAQYYGDAPVVRQLLEQYWGPAAMLRRLVSQPYGDALRLRQGIDQEWGLNTALLAMMEQRYSVAGDRYLALAEQAYNINEYQLLRRSLEQISVIAADTALLQRPAISVTADGEPLEVSHVSIEIDEAALAVTGEIHPADQAAFLRCRHLETVIVITIDADQYSLLVEAPRSSRPGVGQEIYIVPLASPTILLDAPYAVPLTQEFAGAMASTIVAGLAAVAGITVVWQMVDWYLPPGSLYANAETPLAVIRKIVAAAGGLLQTSPAGELLCRAEYPLPLPSWPTATPAHYLTDMDNFFSVDSTPEIRDGYNKFLVADQDAAADLGLTLDQIDIDEHKKEVRVYQVPFHPAAVIALQTSGGSWVGIVSEGIVVETLTEQVEIVAGEGHTAKPITAKTSHDYRETVLGAITVAEDGHLATEIAGNSLVEVVYTTTYRKYIVTDPQIEDVQFYPVEVSA